MIKGRETLTKILQLLYNKGYMQTYTYIQQNQKSDFINYSLSQKVCQKVDKHIFF